MLVHHFYIACQSGSCFAKRFSLSKPGEGFLFPCCLPHCKPQRQRKFEDFIPMEVVMRMAIYAVALVLGFGAASVNAQSPAPAPAPTSDGIAVDQGIAYVLMLLALVLTYIIH